MPTNHLVGISTPEQIRFAIYADGRRHRGELGGRDYDTRDHNMTSAGAPKKGWYVLEIVKAKRGRYVVSDYGDEIQQLPTGDGGPGKPLFTSCFMSHDSRLSWWGAARGRVHHAAHGEAGGAEEGEEVITESDLHNWFTYHPPAGDQLIRYQEIRDAGLMLAHVILRVTPPCADQTAALRKVREAVWTANAAIACYTRAGAGSL